MRKLLHIGVPKTGTTAVQAALSDLSAPSGSSDRAVDARIFMPGTPAEQGRAALSVLGRSPSWRPEEAVASPRHWPRLVERVRTARTDAEADTVVVSSEFLCEADPEAIARIVTDLGPDDLRVVVTLRPLGRILPSAWQQYLKSGHQLPYERWLRAVLADPPKPAVTPSFWRRHDHAAVLERWAAGVGADRLTVVVLDDSDRSLLLRAFDDLLGLPAGTLREGATDGRNRSLTAAEAELFRRLNVALRRNRVAWDDYAHLVRYGAVLRTVRRHSPAADAARTATPHWALARAHELGRDHVDRIRVLTEQGLRVVGDLESLAVPPPVPSTPEDSAAEPEVGEVPVDVAVEALLGVIARSAHGSPLFPDEVRDDGHHDGLPGTEAVPPDRLPADRLTTRQLGDLLCRRLRGGIRRRGRALLGHR